MARGLQDHTWDTFSVNWNTDVRIAFEWIRQVLLMPLKPGSRVLIMGSGASLAGSPLSGCVTPAVAGEAFVELAAADEGRLAPAYLLTGDGLRPLPRDS
jgi:hypothetical protein